MVIVLEWAGAATGPSSSSRWPQACLTAGCSSRWRPWWWAAIGQSRLGAAAADLLVTLPLWPPARPTCRPSPACSHLCPTGSGELEVESPETQDKGQRDVLTEGYSVQPCYAVGSYTDLSCRLHRHLSLCISIWEHQEERATLWPGAQRRTRGRTDWCSTVPHDRTAPWQTHNVTVTA